MHNPDVASFIISGDSDWMEKPADPQPPTSLDLWQRWPHFLILGMAFMLIISNYAWQVLILGAHGGIFLAVLGGAVLGVLLPLYIWSRRLGIDRQRDLRLDLPRPGILLAAALMAVCSLAPTSFLAELSLRLKPADPQWAADLAANMPKTWGGWILVCSATVLAAPLVEEILFRGLIHRTASLAWGPVPAALVSSLLFAIIHSQPWFIFGLLGVGLVLAFVFEATGSVTTCIVTHGVYNAISLVMISTAGEDHAQTSPLTLTKVAWVAVSLAAMIMLGRWLRDHTGTRPSRTRE